MRGSRRTALLRTLYAVLVVEGAALALGAGSLGVMAVAVRREGDEVAGLDKLLILAAVLTAGLAALCAGSIFAVRDTLRDGFGALGRAATLGMIHLWTAILAVTLDGPLWLLAPTGIPAVFYLSSWWLLKERRRDDLLLLETEMPAPRRAEPRQVPEPAPKPQPEPEAEGAPQH
ncbi:hypothetical protein ACPA54_23275 [Uniformispora flossi]|uniref:hypothetical protein n=1 Tax=Uniformispora flossi TaxID=3390723 RepID=UPI003C30E605